jgi:hypothetical protein
MRRSLAAIAKSSMSRNLKGISPSSMMVQLSRFDISTRLQAGSSGHLQDIWSHRPVQDGLNNNHMHGEYRIYYRIMNTVQTPIVPNNYLPCIWTAGATTRNPLQLERVGLAQIGLLVTNSPSPAGPWSRVLTNPATRCLRAYQE